MARRFINKKTTRLYEKNNGNSYSYVLIFGDRVETLGSDVNGRTEVMFREKYKGYIKTDDLDKNGKLEIYFIDVGQADAAFVTTPKGKKILIDGGGNDQAKRFFSLEVPAGK